MLRILRRAGSTFHLEVETGGQLLHHTVTRRQKCFSNRLVVGGRITDGA